MVFFLLTSLQTLSKEKASETSEASVTLAEEDKLDNRINKEYTYMHTGRSDLLEFDLSR